MQQRLEHFVREDFNSVVTAIAYLLVVILAAFVVHNFRDNIARLLLANISNRELVDHSRDESNKTRKANFWLSLYSILVYTLLVNYLLCNITTEESITQYISIPLLFTCLLLVVILKMASHKFFGFLFKIETLSENYMERVQLKNNSFALFILPILIFAEFNIFFSIIFVKIILILTILFLVVKWYNGLKVGLIEGNFLFVYSILYICTLEILPIALIAKVLWKPIQSLLA